MCNRNKRLSYSGSDNKIKNKLNEVTTRFVQGKPTLITDEDWKTQTYEKFSSVAQGFEPIIENPVDEAIGSSSQKKIRKKRDFNQFYMKEMHFIQDKYNHIASEQLKKEEVEVNQYKSMRESMHLMSNGSRKILHTKLKNKIVNNEPGKTLKMSKLFNTPVHERLFVDNINRKKRIEELKNFYQEF